MFSGEPYSLNAETLEQSESGFVEQEVALSLLRNRMDLCFQAADILACEVRDLRKRQADVISIGEL